MSSNVFSFAALMRAGEGERERSVCRVAGKINPVGEVINFSRAARGVENIEIAREHPVAAGNVERALAGVGAIHFCQPDQDSVFARGQIWHGHGEIGSVNFLAKRFLAAFRRALDRQVVISPAVVELAADQDLSITGDACFLAGKGDSGGKANGENGQRIKNRPLHGVEITRPQYSATT